MKPARSTLGALTLVGAFALVALAFHGLAPTHAPGPAVRSALAFFLAAGAGSRVAQRPLWLATALLWLGTWSGIIALLCTIAAPSGQASLAGVLDGNAASLLVSAVAAYAGVKVGAPRARRDGATNPH